MQKACTAGLHERNSGPGFPRLSAACCYNRRISDPYLELNVSFLSSVLIRTLSRLLYNSTYYSASLSRMSTWAAEFLWVTSSRPSSACLPTLRWVTLSYIGAANAFTSRIYRISDSYRFSRGNAAKKGVFCCLFNKWFFLDYLANQGARRSYLALYKSVKIQTIPVLCFSQEFYCLWFYLYQIR